jgi:hypothetical protein
MGLAMLVDSATSLLYARNDGKEKGASLFIDYFRLPLPNGKVTTHESA